jgi:hypothetical protein
MIFEEFFYFCGRNRPTPRRPRFQGGGQQKIPQKSRNAFLRNFLSFSLETKLPHAGVRAEKSGARTSHSKPLQWP